MNEETEKFCNESIARGLMIIKLEEKLKKSLDALQFAEGALIDAVANEDGLDGDTGLRIAKMCSDVLLLAGLPSAYEQHRLNHPDNAARETEREGL